MRAFVLDRPVRALCALAVACALSQVANAALFEDDQARRAILELRQRVDILQQTNQRSDEEGSQMRRSLLELQSQIDTLKTEAAKLRGQNEQLLREVSELQRRQKDISKGVDERLRQFEPAKVTVDGEEFQVEAAEKRDFEAALAQFRSGSFTQAQTAFERFAAEYPRSGYLPSARFWLGNAQYANRDYKGAIGTFKVMLTSAPNHARAPEALLSIANCQMELKETKGARKTLEDLVSTYPQSEAALAAKERLTRLK